MTSLRRLFGNTSGGIAPIAAILGVVVIGCGALAVDVGSFYLARRSLQGAADLAALAAADSLLPNVSVTDNLKVTRSAASAVLAANGYDASVLVGVDLGTYSPDTSVSALTRFATTSGSGANGLRLTVSSQTSMFFGKIFMDPASVDPNSGRVRISATSTAARSRFASFSIDSTLGTLNGGIMNAVMTALFGSNVNLSVMSYQGLMNSQIDLFSFSKALATQINFSGTNYNSLFNMNVQVSDVLTAMANSGGPNVESCDALRELSRLASSKTIQLSKLIDFGPFAQMSVGGTPAMSAKVSVFSFLSQTMELANGNHIISSDLSAQVPMLGSLVAYLAVGERPVNAPWVTVGAEGATVHTAQTRFLLDATVHTSPVETYHLPIYIELASGTATISKLSCEPVSAVVSTTPALYSAWIGNVTPALMQNLTHIANPGPAPLYSIANLGTVMGLANSAVTNLQPTSLGFSQTDVSNNTPLVAKTKNFTTSFVTSLLSTLQLSLNGVSALPPGAGRVLNDTLTKATNPLDGAINSVLTAMGISMGVAQVHVSDVRCDGSVLVQ